MMKKQIINLKYPENLVIKSPHFKRKIRVLFAELPQTNIDCILSFLRLAEIVSFYRNIRPNSKLRGMKQMMMRSLILSTRIFSKWEQQQFLDQILDERSNQKHVIKLGINQSPATSRIIKRNQQYNLHYSPSLSNLESINNNSILSYFREKIGNDVQRTYFKNEKSFIQTTRQKNRKKQQRPRNLNLISHASRLSDNSLEGSQVQTINDQEISKMQQFLTKVLLKVSRNYPQLGYIQGFNYIVKNMYLTGFNEQQAYRYMSYLISVKGLGQAIENYMHGLRQLSYVLKVYIFNYVPAVYDHFQALGVQTQIFSISWFVTLFSEDLSTCIVNKIWHLFILQGWKVFIQFSISILCVYQNFILKVKDQEIFAYIRRLLSIFNADRKVNNQINNQVWKLMASIEVSDFIIKELSQKMDYLYKDPEIQIWKLYEASRRRRVFSQKKLTFSTQYQDREATLSSHVCCDRIPVKSKPSKSVNFFPFCRNIGSQID